MNVSRRPVNSVVVVGAGLVGLSTAWFLQEQGVSVTVLDRKGVAAGSSWGNAGWIAPGLVLPLPEPSVLRYGLKSLLDPTSALYVPLTFDPKLWAFLTRFAMHCTNTQWRRAMSSYVTINHLALGAYDVLASGGVAARTNEAPIMAAYEHDNQSHHLRHELALLAELGQPVSTTDLTGDEARHVAPNLSERVNLVMKLEGQRYFDPGAFAQSLADSIVARGGTIESGVTVSSIRQEFSGVTVVGEGGESFGADAIVLATGAWLNRLGKNLGVRMRVQAGRGYSFSVSTDEPVPAPLYFPALRIACTPYRSGLRIGGTMEFRSANHPLDPRRIAALVKVATPMLHGVDWATKTDEWVGPRPVTSDGLPLIGPSADPRVFVAGGHGMWGIALGPITGQLLAKQMVTGVRDEALNSFDPLRSQ